MKRKIVTTLLVVSCSVSVWAGGLMTNTNQSASWARRISADATIDDDNLYSNPAGMGFLKKDGMHISSSSQMVWQTRTVKSTFAPFAGNLNEKNNGELEYVGKTYVPVIPSLMATYKKEKWTVSGYFAITGGGGSVEFADGLGSFERPISLIPNAILGAKGYAVKSYLNGEQYIYGLQLGGSYKPADWLNVFVGLRGNIAKYHYDGHIRNIQTSFGGKIIDLKNMSAVAADRELDCSQSGFGLTPVVGIDVKYKMFNLAVKYEHRTKLTLKNDTKADNTGLGMFNDGDEFRNDIPGFLSVGLQVGISEKFRVAGGYHHFFDKQAKIETVKNDVKINKQDLLDKGTNEYSFGVEYDALKWLQVSAGYQRTKYGITDEYLSDMSFTTSSNTIGCGVGFRATEWMDINLGAFITLYEHYKKDYTYQVSDTLQLPTSDDFSRTNKVIALGVNFHF